jgi:hypothetical protein
MRRILLAVAGALLVCACAGAKDETRSTPTWAVGKQVRQGEVFTVSDEHLALFDPHRPNADGLTLRVSPSTTWVVDGREAHRADVEEGMPVRVYYEPGSEEPVATRVEVMGARSK